MRGRTWGACLGGVDGGAARGELRLWAAGDLGDAVVAVALLGLACVAGLAAVAREPLGEEATAAGATVPSPLLSQPPRFTRPDGGKAV